MAGSIGLFCAFVLLIALGGCSPVPFGRGRPDPGSVTGSAAYVERCEMCHGDRIVPRYAVSAHAAKGVRCGQCHAAGNHPDFTQPVRDGKCGGCHQPEFQQTLTSKHFATRVTLTLDADRPARVALRRDGFVVGPEGEQKFAGDAASGELGGRLCAACHYDEHRLGASAVQRADFCSRCHASRDDHFPMATPANRCVVCHVRVGETVTGQLVNSHRFAIPGRGQ